MPATGKVNVSLACINVIILGDHVCSIEVTAKYRSVFTIIKGSYFRTLVTA